MWDVMQIRVMSIWVPTLMVLIGSDVYAEPVPIVNPGFESVSRELVGGEQSNGIGGEGVLVGTQSPYPFGGGSVDWSDPVLVPGWRTRTVPFGSPGSILAGVLRPMDIDGMPFVIGIEGDHVLPVQAALVGQATEEVLAPDTTYTLSFLGGISRFDSDYFFAVSLIAVEDGVMLPLEGEPGVTRLEIGRFFPPSAEPDGVMRRYEFSYTTPEVLPDELVGTRVGIHVFGSDGLPRVVYDDFSLTAEGGVGECVVDYNDDDMLDFLDISAFIGYFGDQDPLADLSPDGEFDFLDISEFVRLMAGGCP